MILRKITLDNFRQIYGKHEITFALPGSRNVTVILGYNQDEGNRWLRTLVAEHFAE